MEQHKIHVVAASRIVVNTSLGGVPSMISIPQREINVECEHVLECRWAKCLVVVFSDLNVSGPCRFFVSAHLGPHLLATVAVMHSVSNA